MFPCGRFANRGVINEHECNSMRKPNQVPVTLLEALAQFVMGRHQSSQTCYCVDEENRVVADFNCQTATLGLSYHYVYGGSSEGKIGDLVEWGSRTPSVESPYLRGFGGRGSAGG